MEKGGEKMKRVGLILAAVLFSGLLFAKFGGSGASSAWGGNGVIKKISIQQGTSVSVWTDRGNIVQMAEMQPVGDGTYYIKISTDYGMVPGATYNFLFFVVTPSTWAPSGLTPGTTYAEPVPNYGSDAGFVVCTDSTNVSGTLLPNAGYYSSLNGDARRILEIPYDVNQLWVYCNFASTPQITASALPAGKTSIELSWTPVGSWGSGFPAVDVIVGGKYYIYRSSGLNLTYQLILSTAGSVTSYTDTGLTTGVTYYYVFVATDAYKGAVNPATKTPDANLVTRTNVDSATPNDYYDAWARPSAPIPVYFKIEKPNWEYIEKHGYIVYLTPVGVDGRFYPFKVPGRIVRVYLPEG